MLVETQIAERQERAASSVARVLEALAPGPTTTGLADRQMPSLSGLFSRDDRTNRTSLSIPLPSSIDQERLTSAISGLITMLSRSASVAPGGSKQ